MVLIQQFSSIWLRPYSSGLTDDKVVSFHCKLLVIILELTMKNNSALILLERHFLSSYVVDQGRIVS